MLALPCRRLFFKAFQAFDFCISTKTVVSCTRNKSNDSYFDDPGAPRVALTKDQKTIVMYHPAHEVSYDKTIPIQRDDPRYNFNSVNDLVRERLEEAEIAHKPVEDPSVRHMFPMHDRDVLPTVMELSSIFYTSKHRWFPNKAKKMRQKNNPPQDRPFE
ncbi:large ribosomal subunit protein mL42-like [Clavelina lepadiformis]|uniref:Large ribosomal subunit protein mL42 n=1 Tax=Clavelina lepadiformis TaxID=159417 RepID=A0ABP0GT20_CLALP